MPEDQGQPKLGELWTQICDERRRVEMQTIQLAALQLSEFVAATRHIVAVAEEVQRIAHQAHMAHVVRVEAGLKQFVTAAGRTAEVAAELQAALVGAGLATPAAAPSTVETTASAQAAEEREAEPIRLELVTEADRAAQG